MDYTVNLTKQLFCIIHKNIEKFDFTLEDLQDVLVSNSPFHDGPAIHPKHGKPYTIIPDNVTLFINQIKVKDTWQFIK